jgi:hypothetical protein
MDIAPVGPPADELQELIEDVRTNLADAAKQPSMRQDPYRIVLGALADILSVFGRSITRWERAVADVIAARVMPDEDRHALRTELVTAVEDGAYRGMRKEANRMIRTLDRRLAVHIGLGGAALLGLGVVIGLLVAPARDVRGMLCEDQAGGGRVCYMWVTPPSGPTKPR